MRGLGYRKFRDVSEVNDNELSDFKKEVKVTSASHLGVEIAKLLQGDKAQTLRGRGDENSDDLSNDLVSA